MISRDELTRYLNRYLDIDNISDVSQNGLQFSGKSNVHKVLFAVDAGVETFVKAEMLRGDFLIVHHGIFWKGMDMRLVGAHLKRVATLMQSGISLYASHLPLDIHSAVGHNVELLNLIGAEVTGRFVSHGSKFIGAVGELGDAVTINELSDIYANKLNCTPTLIDEQREVKRVAVLSGASDRSVLYEAASMGVDLLITGETSDFYHDANDYGISVMFLGHHASEQPGMWALMRNIKKEFPELECDFVDIPTGF